MDNRKGGSCVEKKLVLSIATAKVVRTARLVPFNNSSKESLKISPPYSTNSIENANR